jgi:hypothetical protein
MGSMTTSAIDGIKRASTCPACELEQKELDPWSTSERDGKIYCQTCNRTSSLIPTNLRRLMFTQPIEVRKQLARLISSGLTAEAAVQQCSILATEA